MVKKLHPRDVRALTEVSKPWNEITKVVRANTTHSLPARDGAKRSATFGADGKQTGLTTNGLTDKDLAILPYSLTDLTISGKFSQEGLTSLNNLPNLKFLSLVDCQLDDVNLSEVGLKMPVAYRASYLTDTCIEQLPSSLVRLEAVSKRFTEASLPKLNELKNLTFVLFSGCVPFDMTALIKDVGFKTTGLADEHVKWLPTSLVSLSVDNCQLSTAGLSELNTKFKQLSSVELQYTSATSVDFSILKMPVKLDLVSSNDTSLKTLPPQLTSLSINSGDFSPDGMLALSKLKNLASLTICSSRLESAHLAFIEKDTPIRTLDLTSNSIDDDGAGRLSETEIASLTLCYSRVTDRGIEKISRSEHLTALTLSNCEGVTSTAARYLAKNPKLAHLSLNDTQVNDEGATHLAGMESLKSLELVHTAVTKVGLEKLAAHRGLQHLGLSENQVDQDVAERLVNMHSLQSVDLVTYQGSTYNVPELLRPFTEQHRANHPETREVNRQLIF